MALDDIERPQSLLGARVEDGRLVPDPELKLDLERFVRRQELYQKVTRWVDRPWARGLLILCLGLSAGTVIAPFTMLSSQEHYAMTTMLKRVLWCPAPEMTSDQRDLLRRYAYQREWPSKLIGDTECFDPPD